jgi:hypothetical protein
LPAYIVDLEQKSGTRGDWAGACFPCQLTHGTLYSVTKGRLIIGAEHLLANGWNIMQPSHRFASQLGRILRQLKDSDLKFLSGNGMALQALGAWFLYVAANCRRLEGAKIFEEFSLLRKGNSSLLDYDYNQATSTAAASTGSTPCDYEGQQPKKKAKKTIVAAAAPACPRWPTVALEPESLAMTDIHTGLDME